MFVFFGQRCVAGGGPAAAHFLCLAKESKQRKATAMHRPFGVPGAVSSQSGGTHNSLRSDKRPSFSDRNNTSPAMHKRKGKCCSLRIALLAQHGGITSIGELLNWFEKTAKQLRSFNAMRSEPLLRSAWEPGQ